MVKFVIIPEFFGVNESKQKIKEQLCGLGALEVSFTDENFVVALMNETLFEDFIIKLKEKAELYISDIAQKYNLKMIYHDNEYINFTVVSSCTDYTTMKKIACEINMSAAMYQIINGIPQNEATVVVNFKKTPKGKIINTIDTSILMGDKL